jgi:hypothetical protein
MFHVFERPWHESWQIKSWRLESPDSVVRCDMYIFTHRIVIVPLKSNPTAILSSSTSMTISGSHLLIHRYGSFILSVLLDQ